MSFLNKLKKIFEDKKEEIKPEKISFSEIEKKLAEKTNGTELKISGIKEEINQNILSLVSELKDKKEILKNVNLDKRKEEIKIKQLVRENLNHYVFYVEKLIQDLENLDKDEDYFAGIDRTFNNFDKNSKMAFEKATILVGKEIGGIKDAIRSFHRDFSGILHRNKLLFDGKSRINELNSIISGLKRESQNKSEIEASLESLSRKLSEMEEARDEIKDKIHKIKSSTEYARVESEKQEKTRKKQELESDLLKIKENLDLRSLAKFFHNDKKKSEIIKKYSENFLQAMREDSGLEIANLAREAGKDINFGKIKSEMEYMENKKASEIEESLAKAEHEMARISSGLRTSLEEIEKEKQKLARFREKIEKIRLEIKEKASGLNLELD